MSQHFLLTAAARTVSLKQILRMAEAEAWTVFIHLPLLRREEEWRDEAGLGVRR